VSRHAASGPKQLVRPRYNADDGNTVCQQHFGGERDALKVEGGSAACGGEQTGREPRVKFSIWRGGPTDRLRRLSPQRHAAEA